MIPFSVGFGRGNYLDIGHIDRGLGRGFFYSIAALTAMTVTLRRGSG